MLRDFLFEPLSFRFVLLSMNQKQTVLITGGSGLIGTRLTELLMTKGFSVTHLSRKSNPLSKIKTFEWNVEKQKIDPQAIETADCIIHLAGEGIVDKKWTTKRKQAIIDSRVNSAKLLFKAISEASHKPKAFISASAIGIYGAVTGDKIYSEQDNAATDFTGITCTTWETAAHQFESLMRVAIIRIGIVLATQGGALPQIARPIKFFAGSPLGTGNQYVPWIHIDDVSRIFIQAIENTSMHGTYNAVAPQHITQKELTQAIAKALKRPLFFPNVPAFLLKIMLGERAPLVLEGSRVSSDKISRTGYKFEHTNIDEALQTLL